MNIENGRVIDRTETGVMLKSALRALVDKYRLTMVCTPNQSVILRDISPEQREGVEAILSSYGVKPIEQVSGWKHDWWQRRGWWGRARPVGVGIVGGGDVVVVLMLMVFLVWILCVPSPSFRPKLRRLFLAMAKRQINYFSFICLLCIYLR